MRRIPRQEIRGARAILIPQVIDDVGFGDFSRGEGEGVGVGAGGEIAEGEDEGVVVWGGEVEVEVV